MPSDQPTISAPGGDAAPAPAAVPPPVVVVQAPRETLTPRSRTWAWLRRFAKLWGFALFCVFVVYTFREVALPFLFAILVAYILSPLVDRFERVKLRGKPFPRGLAVVILYINIIALLAIFIGYFIPKLSGDFGRMFKEAPQMIARVNKEWVPKAGAWIDERFATAAASNESAEGGEGGAAGDDADGTDATEGPAPGTDGRRHIVVEPLGDGRFRIDLQSVQLEVKPSPEGGYLVAPAQPPKGEAAGVGKWERSIKHWIGERLKSTEGETKRALEWGQKFVAAIVGGIARLVLVLMVAAFILIDMRRIRVFLRSLVPDQYQTDYDRITEGIDRGLSGVIRGQLVICLINGALTYVGLMIFKVKYALLLAGLAAVMSLIPIFGSVLSSIPIVAIALISSGTFDIFRGLKILLWIIGIHQVEANFLNPKIMGDSAKIHPVLVVFALIAGEHSYGLVGALFAVPVASIIQTMFIYFRRRKSTRHTAPAAAAAPIR
jgi:predicted PurR-regulated permease PerM